MNERAAVILTGTTVAYGSLMHDVVRAAKGEETARWIAENDIVPRYFPAILHEGTPQMRSLWERRWPLEQLLADRNKIGFALNMMNAPPEMGSGPYWRRDMFTYDAARNRQWVLYVDPAISAHATSVCAAMVVAGAHPSGKLAWIDHCEAGHYSPDMT